MASLTSRSGYDDGAYESETRGPGGGSFTMRGRGGGGGGMDFMSMFESMLADKQQAARDARAREGERFKWEKETYQRGKNKNKLGVAKRGAAEDPMRYATRHAQAAQHAQESAPSGVFDYGQGKMAAKLESERARETALSAYPMYYQSMMGA